MERDIKEEIKEGIEKAKLQGLVTLFYPMFDIVIECKDKEITVIKRLKYNSNGREITNRNN